MPYALYFSKQALKDLEKINDPFYSNIKQAISDLALDPRPHGYIKLKGRDGYRIRVGNYRVLYDIFDTQLVVDIVVIGHRKDIYE